MKKHISYRSAELLSVLNSRNQLYFTIEEAGQILVESEEPAVRKLLSSMTKRGLLLRIKDGLYHIIPYEKNIGEYYPNWHIVAEKLVQPEEYYIGYYSALDIHGVITQPSLVEQVVTKKQFLPGTRKIKNVRYQFITLSEERFFGSSKIWIDDYNKVWCSDLEKTIIDCLYIPKYANGLTEIIKAVYRCRDKIDSEKMQKYLDIYGSEAVLKRLGFILDNLGILNSMAVYINGRINKSYSLLDPSFAHRGKHNSRWKIIDNIGIEESMKSLET